MKLIIEIDPRIVHTLQNNKGLTLGQQFVVCDAIKNGTPLDSVKAEIVRAYDDVTMYSCDEQVSRFASIVCGILNRICKAESED